MGMYATAASTRGILPAVDTAAGTGRGQGALEVRGMDACRGGNRVALPYPYGQAMTLEEVRLRLLRRQRELVTHLPSHLVIEWFRLEEEVSRLDTQTLWGKQHEATTQGPR